MRSIIPIVICAGLALSGCETTGGDGYITHSDHNLTASERAAVTNAMQNYLKVPVTVSSLKASYDLNTSAVIVCGYVAGLVAGKPTPPSVFGGTLSSQSFVPLKVGGKGQDPQRIATVRAFCQAAHISI
ncbi:hypothetical protein [Mesorhizobium sp. Root552]|uniref:hypothetical protein n=1 Tax=Mesorhizobium sp. Root552 TaxID=1736555 RepID=UPI000A6CFD48|nr:hypothetical protein [Mesorhizobium sp. Root552]